MATRPVVVEKLTAQQRIDLMGQLWDSLDAAVAAPITEELAAELDSRESDADREPGAGESWVAIKRELAKKLK